MIAAVAAFFEIFVVIRAKERRISCGTRGEGITETFAVIRTGVGKLRSIKGQIAAAGNKLYGSKLERMNRFKVCRQQTLSRRLRFKGLVLYRLGIF